MTQYNRFFSKYKARSGRTEHVVTTWRSQLPSHSESNPAWQKSAALKPDKRADVWKAVTLWGSLLISEWRSQGEPEYVAPNDLPHAGSAGAEQLKICSSRWCLSKREKHIFITSWWRFLMISSENWVCFCNLLVIFFGNGKISLHCCRASMKT